MRGRYQGGSLAGFIIIGVVLTLVLVGGLYGLNRYNAEQSKEVAVGADDSYEKTPDDEKSSPEQQPSTDKTSDQSSDQSKNEKQESSSDKNTSSPILPTSGPGDVASAVVAVTVLSFAGMHYLRSLSYRKR